MHRTSALTDVIQHFAAEERARFVCLRAVAAILAQLIIGAMAQICELCFAVRLDDNGPFWHDNCTGLIHSFCSLAEARIEIRKLRAKRKVAEAAITEAEEEVETREVKEAEEEVETREVVKKSRRKSLEDRICGR